ncbi:MAG: serine/threonine-protein kinase [Planctomycetota bacterium]
MKTPNDEDEDIPEEEDVEAADPDGGGPTTSSGFEETRDITEGEILDDATPPTPKTLKHYKVMREIGAGGMGRVFKCLDTTLNRFVAIKMLRPTLSLDEGFVERFRREALAVAKTRHPNIVHIYSIDQEGDHVFYSMEYVEGEGLDLLIERRGPIPDREAVEIIRQAAEGLSHVHRSGILHRDIKPSNLLLDSSNRVLLTDFGLAKMDYQQLYKTAFPDGAGAGRPRPLGETDPGRIMGTPYYMAPECISGRPPDRQSDIYSLGVVFYEILTHRVPFDGESPTEIFQAHLNEIPIPIADLAPETDLKVANVIYRCIEKSPSRRYADCHELLKELNEVRASWYMAKEIEEKKRLSVEIAKAMTLETRPRTFKYKGRLLALIAVLAAAVAFLILISDFFKNLNSKKTLPPGNYAADVKWEVGNSARMVGILMELAESSSLVKLKVQRNWEDKAPIGVAVVDRKVWDLLSESEKPRPNDAVVLEGVIEGEEERMYMRILAKDGIGFPPPPDTFKTGEDGDVALEWGRFRALPGGTRVKVVGWVLWRDANGLELFLGNGWDETVTIRLRPTSTGRFLRVGDGVTVRGRIAFQEEDEGERDYPIVDRAFLLRSVPTKKPGP